MKLQIHLTTIFEVIVRLFSTQIKLFVQYLIVCKRSCCGCQTSHKQRKAIETLILWKTLISNPVSNFFLKLRGATLDDDKVCVLPSNQGDFPCFLLLNLRILAPNLRNETSRIDSNSEKDARKKNRGRLITKTNRPWSHCWKYMTPYIKMTSMKISLYWL